MKTKNKGIQSVLKEKDLYIMLALFVFAFLCYLPSLNYPIMGDSVIYAELTDNLFHNQAYTFQGEVYGKYPPGFALISTPFAFFTHAVFAIKYSNYLWSALTVVLVFVFSKTFGMRRDISVLTSLVFMFNPWSFYFGGILPLSEAFSTFLVVLGLLLYFIDYKKIGGLFFGIAIITRYTAGVIVVPIYVMYLYQIVKSFAKGKHQIAFKRLKESVYEGLLTILPMALWLLFNMQNRVATYSQGYGQYVQNANSLLQLGAFFGSIADYTFVVIPLTFLLVLPLLVYQVVRLFGKFVSVDEKEKSIWIIVLSSFVINIVFYAWWVSLAENLYFPNPWERVRFLLGFIPFLTILAFRFPLVWKRKNVFAKYLTLRMFAFVCIVAFVFLSSYISYGFVKDAVDSHYSVRDIYSQRSWHQVQAIDFVNEDLKDTTIVGLMGVSSANEHKDYVLPYYLDESITYVPIITDPDELHVRNFVAELEANPELVHSVEYILSEYSFDDTQEMVEEYTGIGFGLKQVYNTDVDPKVYVYQVISFRTRK